MMGGGMRGGDAGAGGGWRGRGVGRCEEGVRGGDNVN